MLIYIFLGVILLSLLTLIAGGVAGMIDWYRWERAMKKASQEKPTNP